MLKYKRISRLTYIFHIIIIIYIELDILSKQHKSKGDMMKT